MIEDSCAMSHNVPRLCDVALRPTRPKGHVAEARGAARRSPRRPLRAPMHMNRCYGTLRLKDSLGFYKFCGNKGTVSYL
jgi:hypothetical protein